MNTIIFDMGMVLVDFRWKQLLLDMGYEEMEVEKIGKAVFQNPLWEEFDRGVWSDDKILSAMKEETPEASKDIDQIWKKDNFRNVCAPFHYSEELLKQLHEGGYEIYILSNFGKTLFALDKEMFTFLNYVDGGVISAKVKQMKPDADIYETLLKKYDINPTDAVFFDDRKENCDAARRLGITAVEVCGYKSIIEGLKKYVGFTLR